MFCVQPILVFVSACNSRNIGQAFIDAGVQHVCCVDVDTKLLDKDAVFFTRHFYMNIIHECTIHQAFRRAKAALSVDADSERSNKFLLLPEKADHEKKVFEDVPALLPMERPPTWYHDDFTPPSFPEICENFLGRNLDMYRLLNAILKRQLVTLTGPAKAGKTAVAVGLSHFIWKRRRFIGNDLPYYVHFVKLQGVTSAISAVRKIIKIVLKDMEAIQELEEAMEVSTPYYARLQKAHKSVHDDSSRAGLNELIEVLRIVSEFNGKHNILLVCNIPFCG